MAAQKTEKQVLSNRVFKRVKEHWPVLCLVAAIVFFYWPIVSLKALPYSGDLTGSDLVDIIFPFRFYAHQELLQGQVPLWTDLISGGYPLFAEGQIGFFYPPTILLSLVAPSFLAAFNWSLVLHLVLAAVFFYWLLRSHKLSFCASAFGAFIFVFSGFIVTKLKYPNMVIAMSWAPLGIMLLDRFLKQKKFIFLLLLSAVASLQLLSGHSQMALIIFLFYGAYFLLRLLAEFFSGRSSETAFTEGKTRIWTGLGKPILLALSVMALAVGIAAAQVLPTLELVKHSWRYNVSLSNVLVSPYHPRNLVMWVFPFFYGNAADNTYLLEPLDMIEHYGLFWEISTYIGIPALLLAVVGLVWLFRHKSREFWPWFLLVFFSLLLAFGQYGGLYVQAWDYLPIFKSFRVPARFLFVTVFSLCFLAGWGLDIFWGYVRPRLKSVWRPVLAVILLCLVVVDLGFFFRKYHTAIPAAEWLEKPESVKFLEQDQGHFRVKSFGGEFSWWHVYQQSGGWLSDKTLLAQHREILDPNFNMAWNVAAADDLTALQIKKHLRLKIVSEIAGVKFDGNLSDFPKNRRVTLTDGYLKILGVSGVKYILTFFTLENPRLALVHQVHFQDSLILPLNIYENKITSPLAYVAMNPRPIATDGQLLQDLDYIEALMSAEFIPGKDALIEDARLFNGTVSGGVEILSWDKADKEFKVTASQPGWLAVTLNYYPGWKATVSGVPSAISKANYLFSAVQVPAGQSSVKLHYDPDSYRTGKKVSLASLGGFFVLLLVSRVYRRSKN